MSQSEKSSKEIDPRSYGKGYKKGYSEGYQAALAGLSENPYAGLAENPEMPLSSPIECLDLAMRPYNCLSRDGVITVGQLISKTEAYLRAIRNFGDGSLDNVKARLAVYEYVLADD